MKIYKQTKKYYYVKKEDSLQAISKKLNTIPPLLLLKDKMAKQAEEGDVIFYSHD